MVGDICGKKRKRSPLLSSTTMAEKQLTARGFTLAMVKLTLFFFYGF
jgi:hypothetical protein